MVDYNNLVVRRMIMHTIHAKLEHQDSATTTHENVLIQLNENVLNVIKERLINAAGKTSKAFELEFAQTGDGSFFSLCDNLANSPDAEFIAVSQQMADLLATSQRKANIPGGYLLVMDCEDDVDGTAVYIVIKAEPHEALQRSENDGQITVDNVFLSPTQKLYKIGTVAERAELLSDEPSGRYRCFLFDDQFRLTSHPAEYFYKDFLGFSVGANEKIQTQRFFDKTERFIKEHIEDVDQRIDLLRALRLEFTANQNDTVSPAQFAQTYLPTPGLRGQYMDEIGHELPMAIVKDPVLIKNRLSKRKIDFPYNINITGPDEAFDDRVYIVPPEELGEINLADTAFTLVRIAGQPYTSHE